LLIATPDLIGATVRLEQSAPSGQQTIGTGFLISARGADGSPQTILVTANHVFVDMKGPKAEVGYRIAGSDGSWRFAPRPLRIRTEAGAPLWTADGAHDVAAIRIEAPPRFARAAIPMNYLASGAGVARQALSPGEELFVLGYPEGLAANAAGFPILRSGRIASYPVSPALSATFLLDFAVFPGNSGGPVFSLPGLQPAAAGEARPAIVGMLTRQVEVGQERLEIGIVTHAEYIAGTIQRLGGAPAPAPAADPPAGPLQTAAAALQRPAPPACRPGPDPLGALGQAFAAALHALGQVLQSAWLALRQAT